MSVLGDIGNQARVVLKHFTPSTFDPWKGAVVRTFVETYSEGVCIDCPVTSSSCIQVPYITEPVPAYASNRTAVLDGISSSQVSALVLVFGVI